MAATGRLLIDLGLTSSPDDFLALGLFGAAIVSPDVVGATLSRVVRATSTARITATGRAARKSAEGNAARTNGEQVEQ